MAEDIVTTRDAQGNITEQRLSSYTPSPAGNFIPSGANPSLRTATRKLSPEEVEQQLGNTGLRAPLLGATAGTYTGSNATTSDAARGLRQQGLDSLLDSGRMNLRGAVDVGPAQGISTPQIDADATKDVMESESPLFRRGLRFPSAGYGRYNGRGTIGPMNQADSGSMWPRSYIDPYGT
jgi:hypothetical protein